MSNEDTLNARTLEPEGLVAATRAGETAVLTIAAHPERHRIGAEASLDDGHASLSRLSPLFDGAPLRDRHLSRRAIEIQLADDGSATIVADPGATTLRLDGEPRVGLQRVDGTAVDRGVVLTLAEGVVLVLHRASSSPPPSDDLGLVGRSRALGQVREQIGRVASHDVPVLIRGESGTGKELVASAIHRQSSRRAAPFITVNMAALVPSTAAASLFGHEKGAFTGAERKSQGFFGEAEGGTLFLDEVGELPSDIQPALLRALDSREVQPLGASRTIRRDVRLLAATDALLERMVEDGAFRLPLLQRLSGYEITLSPLRERRVDIAILLHHFLGEAAERAGWLPATLVERALLSAWSGNVRQLRNFVQRLVIDWGDRERVELADDVLGRLDAPAPSPSSATRGAGDSGAPTMKGMTEDQVIAVLQRYDYKLGPAARALGVSRTSLYALIDASTRIRKAAEIGEEEVRAALAQSSGDVAAAARHLEVSARGLTLRINQLGVDPTSL